MADDDQICKDHDRLRAAIDLGSGVAKIASQHVLAGEKAYNVAIEDVHIVSLLRPDAQQIVVIDDNCQVMLGDDGKPLIGTGAVAQWAFQHPEESGRILELFKLALCHESKQSVAVQRVYDVLEVKAGDFGAPQIMIRSILACFKRAVIHWYQTYSTRNLHGQYTATYWEALPIELQITVPCMWKAQERGVMRDSLVEARFTNVRFRSEPTCAAARIMSILFDRKDIAVSARSRPILRREADISTDERLRRVCRYWEWYRGMSCLPVRLRVPMLTGCRTSRRYVLSCHQHHSISQG